jgi:hypothetical protein
MNQFPSATEIRQGVKALGECRDRAERIAAQWPGLMLSRDEVDGRFEHKVWPWEANGLWSPMASRLDDVLRGPCGVLLREDGQPPEDDASPFVSELLVFARGHVSISTPEDRIDRPGSALVFISARDPRATTTDLPDAAMHAIVWIERQIDRLEAAGAELATQKPEQPPADSRVPLIVQQLNATHRETLLAVDALQRQGRVAKSLTADSIADRARSGIADAYFRRCLSDLVKHGLLLSPRSRNHGGGYGLTIAGDQAVLMLRG